MALIQPDSDIILLHNIPLDVKQEHSITFADKTAQFNYFNSKAISQGRFTDYSYQRHSIDKIKIEVKSDDIFDVNYMMFRNTAFGTKWFYAFVTEIEYINNVTSLITYEIDDLQTWLFDFEVKECFVVREMPEDDYANEQVVPEPLETGDYVVSNIKEEEIHWENTKICALVTNPLIDEATKKFINPDTNTLLYSHYGNPGSQHVDNPLFRVGDIGDVRCGMLPTGLLPIFFQNDETGRENFSWYLTALQWKNNTSSIVSAFLVPSIISADYYTGESGGAIDKTYYVDAYIPNSDDTIYRIPRPLWIGTQERPLGNGSINNMKLYNYPYCFPFISDGIGNISTFMPQYFERNDGNFKFSLGWCCTSTLELTFTPVDYKGLGANYNETYVFNKFPQISWVTDYFAEYWSQNKINITAGVLGDLLSGVNSIYTGNANYAMNMGMAVREGALAEQPITAATKTRTLNMQDIYRNTAEQAQKAGGIGALSSAISIAQTVGNVGIARRTSDRNVGVQDTDFLASVAHTKPISGIMSVTKDMALVIDEYFTMYGYATHRVKVPNWKTHTRPTFNYVQTLNTNIVGSLPQDSLKNIIGIFERGITWWHNTGDYIGDYGRNNRATNRGQYRH